MKETSFNGWINDLVLFQCVMSIRNILADCKINAVIRIFQCIHQIAVNVSGLQASVKVSAAGSA